MFIEAIESSPHAHLNSAKSHFLLLPMIADLGPVEGPNQVSDLFSFLHLF